MYTVDVSRINILVAYSVSKLSAYTVLPPSYFSVLENVQAVTHKNYVVRVYVKLVKQHNIAVTVNIRSIHP